MREDVLLRVDYYTDAAGNEYSWDGVGGVTKYVLDVDNGTLRMPDVRGLHMEAAGYNALAVGAVACDQMRQITGTATTFLYAANGTTGHGLPTGEFSGALTQAARSTYAVTSGYATVTGQLPRGHKLDASRVAPTGPRNNTARYGVLPCVYLGS